MPYCQNVQYRRPPGSAPGSAVPYQAIHSGFEPAKARLLPVHSFHHWAEVWTTGRRPVLSPV